MFLVVFYSKLLLYNDLGGYNAESLQGAQGISSEKNNERPEYIRKA